jgi:glycosyltransferase involved in cell wall biosynthesis
MLVSVYMPTRNRIARLGKAIDSVLAQTYKSVELIVVDDASSDATGEYLRRKAGVDSRLVHLHNSKLKGAQASRNIAILQSRGEFVTGLDDDDEFLPDRVSAFVEYWNLLISKGVRPSCLYAQDIWLNNGVQSRITQKRSSVIADDLFEGNFIGNQIFAPRTHFIEAGLFDEQLPAWQDFEFFIRVLQRFGAARLLDMATYLFDATLRPDRISSQETKIRHAFEIVANKHSLGITHKQKALFLQIFQDTYDIYPSVSDWIRFLRWGHWPKGSLRMLRRSMSMTQHKYLPSPNVSDLNNRDSAARSPS